MQHKADIGFVDAHAESVRRHHHPRFVIQKRVLVALALVRRKARVITRGRVTVSPQLFAHLFHGLARQAVHNARSARVGRQIPCDGRVFVPRFLHTKIQIRPVEARHHGYRVREAQQAHDILPHLARGRGRKRPHHGAAGQRFQKAGDIQIPGAEILPPLRHAVGLVHTHHADVHALRKILKARREQPLGRDVDDFIHTFHGVGYGLRRLPLRQGRVQVCGAHAALHQRVHLVLHQADERRHHQRDARQQQRGQLVAHGFARARGHDAHGVAPLQKRVDELLLPGAKTLVAENRFEQRAFFTHRLCFHSKNSS